MCGILIQFICTKHISNIPFKESQETVDYDSLKSSVSRRGPDLSQELIINHCKLFSSVLHIRANSTPQPLITQDLVLMWNGEVYGTNCYGDLQIDLNKNDTEEVMRLLGDGNVNEILAQLEGEFAYVVYDRSRNRVYFGRDYLGRRSLLFHYKENVITISSCGPGDELLTSGVYCIDFENHDFSYEPWYFEQLRTPSMIRFANNCPRTGSFEDYLNLAVHDRLIGHGNVGVLFSGGLDSAMISLLSSYYLTETLYLISVSFSQDAPDKQTSIQTYKDLLNLVRIPLCLILVEVSVEELDEHRPTILNLMHPSNTHMDFSIASALYFAARGKGRRYHIKDGEVELGDEIIFPGKILLSGLGADEIFGGYARYKIAHRHDGNSGVQREMALDIDRIWHRNMGRDDRIISYHAREVRFPFLDSKLWAYLSTLDLSEVTKIDQVGGDKCILRRYAENLGLSAATFKKRAIQFGSRVAQVSNIKYFGSHRAAKGWADIHNSKDQHLSLELKWCLLYIFSQIVKGRRDEDFLRKARKTVLKLSSPEASKTSKRNMMRVALGDYTSLMKLQPMESLQADMSRSDVESVGEMLGLEKQLLNLI